MKVDILKKLITYRSNHRGCKETDKILGEYIEKNIDKLDDEKLLLYSDFLQEDDVYIYDAIIRDIYEEEFYNKYQYFIKDIRNNIN